jgi:hypothetical protein
MDNNNNATTTKKNMVSDKGHKLKTDVIFTGMEQCSSATGISMDMLKRCKTHPDSIDGSNGFHISGRVYWSKLKPWIQEHGEELLTGNADDYFKWRAIKMEAEAKLVQIELEERRNKLIEKQYVHDLLKRIALAQSSLMNSKFRAELVPKVIGMTEQQVQLLMDATISDVMSIMQREVAKWSQ